MHTMKEALWLCSFIGEVVVSLDEPITLFSDNQSAIVPTKDHQYHMHTKQIDIHFHFICWVVNDGKIWLIFCPTNDMVANTLIKVLPSPKVKHFAAKLGLCMDWRRVLESTIMHAATSPLDQWNHQCAHAACPLHSLHMFYIVQVHCLLHIFHLHLYSCVWISLDPSYPFCLLFSHLIYNFPVVSWAPQFVVCTWQLRWANYIHLLSTRANLYIVYCL